MHGAHVLEFNLVFDHVHSVEEELLILAFWLSPIVNYMSCVMRKPGFCLCENKDADQLCSSTFVFGTEIASTIPFLPKSEISSF